MTAIIGISALFHDSACCLIKDGKLVAAVQEERFTRIKNDPSMPIHSFNYCLKQGNLNVNEIDVIAYYEDPSLKIARQLDSGYSLEQKEYVEKLDKRWVERMIRKCLGYEGRIEYHLHHLSHAASSYLLSGFDSAAILINDGVGEWATTSYGVGREKKINLFRQVDFPHSIGLLYSAVTAYLGFKVNNGEYKVMGLAPYGKPKFVDKLEKLYFLQPNGGYTLNASYFEYVQGSRMFSSKLEELLGQPARVPESEMTQFYKDVAHSLQVVLHKILKHQIDYLYQETKEENLCLAGGVALNCVGNRYIREHSPFKNIFIQPASGDAGNAVGAALLSYENWQNQPLTSVYLGTTYESQRIERLLKTSEFSYECCLNEVALFDKTADLLAAGNVIGWFQGKMEFGPRALGNRSILADPRGKEIQGRINEMVKKRENFRPFAPAVLEEEMSKHFKSFESSPFMLNTYDVKSPLELPAITHVDNSARVQSVNKNQNHYFYRLITSFYEKTGCPILLNTSFNVRGEPIVENPENALDCFISTDLDYLVIGPFIVSRQENQEIINAYRDVHKHLKRKKGTLPSNLYTFI